RLIHRIRTNRTNHDVRIVLSIDEIFIAPSSERLVHVLIFKPIQRIINTLPVTNCIDCLFSEATSEQFVAVELEAQIVRFNNISIDKSTLPLIKFLITLSVI